LVIGIDISDTVTLDPVRQAQYTPPMTLAAVYDPLMTLEPGDYITPKPALATAWRRTPDGRGWRFTLREGVRFASGAALTAEDVQFSFMRLLHMKDQTQQYLKRVERCEVVDPRTIDLVMNDPAAPGPRPGPAAAAPRRRRRGRAVAAGRAARRGGIPR
jgi:peptide/nickel transport system substrate-binding protein